MSFLKKLPRLVGFALFLMAVLPVNQLRAADNSVYQIKVYHYKTVAQKQVIEDYLKDVFVPYIHKSGISKVGVFRTLEADTADRRIYVLVPFKSLKQMDQVSDGVLKEIAASQGNAYANADYKNPPYTRLETIVLNAFYKMPAPAAPELSAPKSERIYELRSYESSTESYFINKVKMFNVGDEVALFKRLNFNAVFYGSVIAGSRMPNLMYMTTFNNKADRDKHWEAFNTDAYWKELSSKAEYQHNVSKGDIIFLQPADYSDF
ncbi:NIPSNAP family protein [Mucilaginibacter pedocola]|uniref:NIPSNAP domain-containing protein n=1 Tax=Mucilaginibacter pedocola TaxID=1792845 RepID=A0A1S9PJK0_9SPHI|nr:NIPSNAP family protein [Mucilaginibacter pedocola]OOQ61132.1 hypothetical protein BC343_22075 [Mucilaginibacter pedocola]